MSHKAGTKLKKKTREACPKGHSLLDPANIKTRSPECLTCDRARVVAHRAKKKAGVVAR